MWMSGMRSLSSTNRLVVANLTGIHEPARIVLIIFLQLPLILLHGHLVHGPLLNDNIEKVAFV